MTVFWEPAPAGARPAEGQPIASAVNGIEIWMGGTNSLLGEPLTLEAMSHSLVVDCSGELPEAYRANAAGYLPRVFLDIETVPAAYPRLVALVHELVAQAARRSLLMRSCASMCSASRA